MISKGTEAKDFLFVSFAPYHLLGNQILDEGFVEDFSEQMETAIRAILYAIQNLAERSSKKIDEDTDQTKPQEEDGMSEIRQKTSFILDLIFYLMI